MRYINGTRLDDRIIRTDWDAGFKEGRQYGRGRSGGQVCSKGIRAVLPGIPVMNRCFVSLWLSFMNLCLLVLMGLEWWFPETRSCHVANWYQTWGPSASVSWMWKSQMGIQQEILDLKIVCTFKCYWAHNRGLSPATVPKTKAKCTQMNFTLIFMPCLFMDTQKGLAMSGMIVASTFQGTVFFPIKVRDEYREDYDAGRGGYGKLAQKQWVVKAPSTQLTLLMMLENITQGLISIVSLLHWKPLLVFLWNIKRQNPKECL